MQGGDFEDTDLRDVVAALMRRHGEKWMRFVLRVVGNQQDAEDVLQEAIQRVLLRNRLFRSEEEARMYLGRAISNTAIEAYNCRKRERLRMIPLKEHAQPASETLSPQTLLEHKEQSDQKELLTRLVREGLADLPTKQYEAVYLTVLEPGGTSIREAGAEKGIPYSTLRHRSVQGLRRLRKFIHRALRSTTPRLILV